MLQAREGLQASVVGGIILGEIYLYAERVRLGEIYLYTERVLVVRLGEIYLYSVIPCGTMVAFDCKGATPNQSLY